MKLVDKILYKEIRGNVWYLVASVAFALSIVGLDALAPWPFKVLIDNVIGGSPLSFRPSIPPISSILMSRELLGFFIVFIYFLTMFLITVTEYSRSVLVKRFAKKLISGFSKEAFAHLQFLAIGFYRKQEIGDYIYRLSYDIAALGTLFEEGILPLLTSGLYLLVTVAIMLLINVKLTLISLLVLPFLAIGLYIFGKNITLATKRSEYWSSAIFSFIEEALTHLKIIQAFSQEGKTSRRFGEKMDASLRSDVTLYRTSFLLSLLVGIIIGLSYSIIIAYGIRSVFVGELTTGLLIVFIFYLDNLTNPLLSLIYATSSTRESYVKISRMRDFFDLKTHRIKAGELLVMKDTGIEFDRVTLRIDDAYILRNVSFAVPPGTRTVILGPNGSGKTTILSLLMRFVDKPDHGRVLIGDEDVSNYNLKVLREDITFVPQEITLFNDTVASNIAFGTSKSSLKEITEAARLAGAHDFIVHLPRGYDFKVGESGNYLSGGQRQKLMIARAFMRRDAKILLFDEIFSALDLKARTEMLNNLYDFSKNKTMMFISHIVSVIKDADYVLVLNDGKVVYFGKSSHFPEDKSLSKLLLEIG